MKKRSCRVLGVLAVILFLVGCGETIRGVQRDGSRVCRGIKTVFVTDS